MRNLEEVGGSSVMYSNNFLIRETCSSCLKRNEKDIRSLSGCLRTVENSWVEWTQSRGSEWEYIDNTKHFIFLAL